MSIDDKNRAAAPGGPPRPLAGEALKKAAEDLAQAIEVKVRERQGGVRTFFDNFLLRTVGELRLLDPSRPWEEAVKRLSGPQGARQQARLAHLQRYLSRRRGSRFADYRERPSALTGTALWPSEIDRITLAMSQGTESCLQWRGMPLFKTAFDASLYPMLLWELKPRSVIELGSGSGSSALWLADLLKGFGESAHVYSLDLRKPAVSGDGVTFLEGDCRDIGAAFTAEFLNGLPHPWLLIEDAHVNVYGVLAHFHPFLESGDYLVVEDSLSKRDELLRFTGEFEGAYKVDTHYCDFFGENATSAFDGIFRRS